ncbi:MAG: ABC transporter substrate-binding protein [Gemmatimonadaceae bacterium]|nr:ABC transporter substrate-binding protein [Acetobacteraceae bacterium]
MKRRSFLATGLASLAAPAVAQPSGARVLRFVPQADLAVLDPIWTTAYQTRDHAFLVFDTLFGQDDGYAAQPQMVDGVVTGSDGLRWQLRLRDGLRFHDGTPVLARDCVASIRRWGARDTFGQALLAATDDLSAPDDRTILFRLRRPFPLLPDALAKTAPIACVIMPERLAVTDAFKQVTEMVGSGPYRFLPDERIPGARVAYARFDGYVPRAEGSPSRTAGPKRAGFDRIEWSIVQDAATASAALQRGEVDWWLAANPDLLGRLRADRRLVVRTQDPTGIIGTMRFNQLHPPFDNAALRRAVLGAVQQSDYMQAVAGPDRSLWADGVGFFCPGTPLANAAGMEALNGPRDLDRSRRAVADSGYKGERVALMMPTDIPSVSALAEVTAELFRKLGLNLDGQTMDWGTAVQRRTNMEPVDRGGWSVFQTSWAGLDHATPAGHQFLRGHGRAALPGWPVSATIETLRDEWLQATDPAAQLSLAEQMQVQAFRDVPYVPLGQQFQQTAFRADLSGVLPGMPVFWNVVRG